MALNLRPRLGDRPRTRRVTFEPPPVADPDPLACAPTTPSLSLAELQRRLREPDGDSTAEKAATARLAPPDDL
jgi:hypothetical protein